jgi:hypothetical protein
MTSLQEIVAAAKHLNPAQLALLQKRIEQLQKRLWKKELATTTAELRRAGIGDRQIDAMVQRRRRESRS